MSGPIKFILNTEFTPNGAPVSEAAGAPEALRAGVPLGTFNWVFAFGILFEYRLHVDLADRGSQAVTQDRPIAIRGRWSSLPPPSWFEKGTQIGKIVKPVGEFDLGMNKCKFLKISTLMNIFKQVGIWPIFTKS